MNFVLLYIFFPFMSLQINWQQFIMNMNYDIYLSTYLFLFKKKCVTFAGSSVFSERIFCLSSSFMTADEEILGSELLAGRRKQPEDVILGSGY